MSDPALIRVDAFLSHYRHATLSRRYSRLKAGYLAAVTRSRQAAPQFNIFRILGIDRDEVRTHSRFLAHLLNPDGSHGQGCLFLEAFLQQGPLRQSINADDSSVLFPFPPLLDQYQWTITTEFQTDRSNQDFPVRLDIVVRCDELGYLYVIENKIDLVEQARQLARYAEEMKKLKLNFPHQALIFLTPDGTLSYTAEDHVYFTMSYRHDVYEWLTSALPQIEAPAVACVVEQYRRLVLRI